MVNYQEKVFKIHIQRIILNIREMEIMFNEVEDNFDKYVNNIPYLSQSILDIQLNTLSAYSLHFEHILTLKFSEIEVNSVQAIVGGFSRVFDFSLSNTELWSERSYNLNAAIGIEFREIIGILDNRTLK